MNVAEVDSRVRQSTDIRFAKNWNVILYNDDTTSQLFVVEVLTLIFEYEVTNAYRIMKNIESAGSLVIAVLPKKLAEARVKKTKDLAMKSGYPDFRIDMKEED